MKIQNFFQILKKYLKLLFFALKKLLKSESEKFECNLPDDCSLDGEKRGSAGWDVAFGLRAVVGGAHLTQQQRENAEHQHQPGLDGPLCRRCPDVVVC